MSVQDGPALARRWMEEVWNQGREETIDEMMTPDALHYGLGPEPIQGPEAFKLYFRQLRGAFPDMRVEVDDAAAVGEDMVVSRFTVTATHRGDHLGVSATGRPVHFEGTGWVRVRDGRAVESWNHVDLLGVLTDIGLVRMANGADESERNRALNRRWFEEVWNARRPEVIDELMDPEAVGHGLSPDGGDTRGVAPFKEFHRDFCGAFPDLRITIEDMLSEGDRTATRITCEGTHLGDHLGIPPTGRPVRFSGQVIVRWRDGRAVEGWNEIDLAAMNRQLRGA